MRYPKYLIPLSLISFLVVCLDQIWKYMMMRTLTYGESVPVIDGFFALTLVFNTGAAFGIFSGRQNLFLILPVLAIILIVILYTRSRDREKLILPLGLLLGGTIGNFIDRLYYGYVIDFFDFYWHSYHWPAFNIADASICIGIVLLIRQTLLTRGEG